MSTTMTAMENPHAGQGAVLRDIGGDIGALVVSMPASLLGTAVEIRPLGRSTGRAGADHLTHVAVVERPVGQRYQPSLVFADLEDGGYELFEKGHPDAVALRVAVVGGEVSDGAGPG
jgi:hypothetical protein